jgi:hypothetical protein
MPGATLHQPERADPVSVPAAQATALRQPAPALLPIDARRTRSRVSADGNDAGVPAILDVDAIVSVRDALGS